MAVETAERRPDLADHAVAAPEAPRIRSLSELRGLLREDLAVSDGAWTPGFLAVAVYRVGVWSRGLRSRILRAPVRALYQLSQLVIRNLHGIELPDTTVVGRRFHIAHRHGIVIHRKTVIGDDCLIRHGVTIGAIGGRAGPGGRRGAPRIGDRVEIGAGAMLVGPIRVGDEALIGPNAVVMTNVPPGAIVSAPPARVVAPPPRRDPGGMRSAGEN